VETETDQALETVWGAEGIHAFIKFPGTIQQLYYHLRAGHIDADKCGSLWVSTKERLRQQFGGANRFNPPVKPEVADASKPMPLHTRIRAHRPKAA
jgi:hypothetical protein